MIVGGVALTSAGLFVAAQTHKLPPPYATPSASNGPRVIAQPAGARLNVPAGFQTEVYAEGFEKPRFMVLAPGGEILLSDSADAPNGAVYVLRGSGAQKTQKKLIGGLNRPYGLAFWKGYLYVAEPEAVKRYKYSAGAVTGDGEQVISLAGQGSHHWTRSLLFDRTGSKLYVGVGSGSNDSPGEDPRRAAIGQYNPDGSGPIIYASGTRNPIGMRWYPGTDALWAAVQERDTLGDDLVPDYFTRIRQGGFYGWPFAYIGPNADPINKGARPDLIAKTLVPDVLLGAHVAVLDFIFYTGQQFPAEYRGGAFLAFHGSWNRSMRVGQSIAFLPFKDGNPSGALKEVLSGWMIAPDKREVWGRPVGLLQLPDGSLLISDDGGRKLWRLSYKG